MNQTVEPAVSGAGSLADHAGRRRRKGPAHDLEEALAAGQVETWFQPQVALADGRLVGFEALARWHHPERGPVPPSEFIAAAEEAGLIDRLGRIVMADSCHALATWRAAAPDRALQVAVNVSARQLADVGLARAVRTIAEDAGVATDAICLELTDSSLAASEVAAATLRRLKTVGVALAVDDFGTGYSFLSHLHRFPLDHLKIDRTFVAGVADRRDDEAIVTAVLGLARGLGLGTVAEGIEDGAQRDRPAALGCDRAQGYLWSPAVPAADALAMVRAGSPTRIVTLTDPLPPPAGLARSNRPLTSHG